MSYLAKLKQIESGKNFKNIPDSTLPKPPKPPFGSFGSTVQGKNKKNISEITAITPEQIKKIQAWLNEIGEPENEHHVVIEKCRQDVTALEYFLKQANDYARDKRREKVFKMLSDHPDQKRAYATDAETDPDNVILTCAIRGMCTFEVLIPKDKYDPFVLMDVLHRDLIH